MCVEGDINESLGKIIYKGITYRRENRKLFNDCFRKLDCNCEYKSAILKHRK